MSPLETAFNKFQLAELRKKSTNRRPPIIYKIFNPYIPHWGVGVWISKGSHQDWAFCNSYGLLTVRKGNHTKTDLLY